MAVYILFFSLRHAGDGARRTLLAGLGAILLLSASPLLPSAAAAAPANSAALSAAAAVKTSGVALRGVKLGDSEAKVLTRLGSPSRKDASEYGFQWYVYNGDYSTFAMIGIRSGIVAGLYSNAKDWTGASGAPLPLTAAAAWTELGAVSAFPKPDYAYSASFAKNGRVFTVFADHFAAGKLAGLLITDTRAAAAASSADKSGEPLMTAYERQLADLANVSRTRLGLKALVWDGKASASAAKHSEDMMVNDYFDHYDPEGTSPFDRMATEGISYRSAAENIAAGYKNAFYAHSGWLNSKGHRVNLLNGKLTRLGTGAVSGGSYGLYYTENFYTPL